MPVLLAGATSGVTTVQATDTVTATMTLPSVTGIVPTQNSTTGALTLPVGTTAQRPTASTGMVRYKSTLGVMEYYNGTAWYSVTGTTPPTAVEYLVVAGGGGGGSNDGGGGGAGGFKTSAVQSQAAEGTPTIGTQPFQRIKVAGSGAAVTMATTLAGGTDGMTILFIGNDSTNTVTIAQNDAANGFILLP